jgi:hypothetical protein
MLAEVPFRYLLVMAVVGLSTAGLSWLGYRAPERRHGWRRLEPSPMHWFGLVVGCGLVLLFLYVRLFVGSSRADAEHQMNILTGLIVAFAAGVLACGWAVVRLRRLGLEWRGSWLAWRGHRGERVVQAIGDLRSVGRTPLGFIVFAFESGAIVKVDEHARGTVELLERIGEKRGDLSLP